MPRCTLSNEKDNFKHYLNLGPTLTAPAKSATPRSCYFLKQNIQSIYLLYFIFALFITPHIWQVQPLSIIKLHHLYLPCGFQKPYPLGANGTLGRF